MGNKIKKVEQIVQKTENVAKPQNIFEGRIFTKDEPKERVIYTTKEDYELSQKKDISSVEELNKLKEEISKEVDSLYQKEQEQLKKQQVLSGKRNFENIQGMTQADSEFLDSKEEKWTLEEQFSSVSDKIETKTYKNDEFQISPKKRQNTYSLGNSLHMPEKLPGTFRTQELLEFYDKMRKLRYQDIEEREELIQEFIKENNLDRKIVENLLKYNTNPIILSFATSKLGLWNHK